ncbi:hypothetical protein F4782DRAFT_347935 [Xylaria castorea]|nr:hypothetical protein F4782DRAFT_347935 [Xylaria castorea]
MQASLAQLLKQPTSDAGTKNISQIRANQDRAAMGYGHGSAGQAGISAAGFILVSSKPALSAVRAMKLTGARKYVGFISIISLLSLFSKQLWLIVSRQIKL